MTAVRPSSRATVRAWLVGLSLAVAASAVPDALPAQDQSKPPPKDTIFARKILMNGTSDNMDEIEGMLEPGATLNLAEGREHADTISIMLMSFPHLFPPDTNQWATTVDRDPALDTYASPDLWTNFQDFYRRASEASKLAFDAANAKSADEFRAQVAQLRNTCNSCHAIYQKSD